MLYSPGPQHGSLTQAWGHGTRFGTVGELSGRTRWTGDDLRLELLAVGMAAQSMVTSAEAAGGAAAAAAGGSERANILKSSCACGGPSLNGAEASLSSGPTSMSCTTRRSSLGGPS